VSAQAAAALALRVERDAVVATEVTRGGSAVFFAVTFETGSVPLRARQATILRDDDGDGTVKLEMPEGVPFIGIWSVTDLATGAVRLATKEGYELIDLEEPAELSFRGGERGEFDRFEHRAQDVELLVVRPGEGAWTLRGTNGAQEDLDFEPNATLVLGMDRLTSLAENGRAASGVRAGDVVVLIDVASMRASAGTVGGAK
jgi:hypothetical protein